MDEMIFMVENAPEGGYTARALGASIFTEADDLEACVSRFETRCGATSKQARVRR